MDAGQGVVGLPPECSCTCLFTAWDHLASMLKQLKNILLDARRQMSWLIYAQEVTPVLLNDNLKESLLMDARKGVKYCLSYPRGALVVVA